MKSIDKLRNLKTFGSVKVNGDLVTTNMLMACATMGEINEIADEIEDEIADNYMRLPVDANNEPIHVGDEIQYVNEHGGTGAKVKVCAIADGYAFYDNGKHIHAYSSDSTRHVKPRTLEDVLVDMLEAAVGYSDAHTDVSIVAVEKYADEIRELLGGDAE